MPHFPRKWFQLRYSKICKKLKNAFFKRSEDSLLSSRLLQNHFLRRFLWPNFDLNSFESFVSLYQKTVSTLLLKNLQKIKKWHFQMFATFAFDLKVASKPSNLKSFDFCLTFLTCLTWSLKNLQKHERCDFETLWRLSSF